MRWLVDEAVRQAKLTAQEPTRVLRLFHEVISQRGRLRRYYSYVRIRKKVGAQWLQNETQGTHHRAYVKYTDYLEHQASKLQHIDLSGYDVWFRDSLQKRLLSIPEVRAGMSALCLGARIGTEVKAFLDIGCFAVGIDLNPGRDNKFVLPGDFHEIQFPANSVDIVYTNSIDHAFDPVKMLAEVRRVVKLTGLFILEAQFGTIEGKHPEDYESFWWDSCADLEKLVNSCAFKTFRRWKIEKPFSGVSLLFNPT
jgi:hypothetical protein